MTTLINITLAIFIATALVCGIAYIFETLAMKSPVVRKLSETLDWEEE